MFLIINVCFISLLGREHFVPIGQRSPYFGGVKDTTITSGSNGVSILAPDDVKPGHIILAPLKMNRIAPLSTCTCGNMNGSIRIEKDTRVYT